MHFLRSAAALAALSLSAHSAVLFSTFGPGDSYNQGVGYTIGGASRQVVAVAFIPAVDSLFDSLRVGVWHYDGPNDFVISLATDVQGKPGPAVEVLLDLAFPPSWTGPSTFFSVTHPLLNAGSTYWLVMFARNPEAGTDGAWNQSSPAVTGLLGFANTNVGMNFTLLPSNAILPAVEVNGSGGQVPEPSTFLLSAAGAVVLAFRSRRRA